MQNVLIVGFSVTAEMGGFVEVAKEQGYPENIEVSKIGIGGIHPFHLQYLMPSILRDHTPDAVIFEIATSGFRTTHLAEQQHRAAIQQLLGACQRHGVPVAFFDLPRIDIDPATDWALNMHQEICGTHGMVYHCIQENGTDLIRDTVHPTPKGQALYAEVFRALLGDFLNTPTIPQIETTAEICDSILLISDQTAPEDLRDFARSGYQSEFRVLPEGAEMMWDVPPETSVIGLTFICGPQSGYIRIASETEVSELQVYDGYCYYERFGVTLFKPVTGGAVTIRQLSGVPEVKLIKGDKDFGPRTGYIAHLLTRTKNSAV